jgi:outer membrane protein assembly factor BamB
VIGWDGRLFVPLGKKIICYTASGRQLWSRAFAVAIRVSPGIDQSGGIILTLESSELLRIDPFGTVQSRELPRQARSIVSLEGGTYMVLYESGGADMLDFSGADTRAAPALPQPPLAAASRGSLAAVCLADGNTLLISGADNKTIWTGESHISVIRKNGGRADTQAAVLFDERGIYVLSPSGATGFAEDGRRLWFIMLENTATIPAFGDDGILYSGGRYWILYAYRLEERARHQNQSLYGPVPPGGYGLGTPPPSFWAADPYRHEDKILRSQLALISAAIQTGELGGSETEWTAYLMETASGEYGQALATAPLQYQVQALRLLARIGSRETIPFLSEIFTRDREPVVRAAAAQAIGAIGVDPDGLALRAFAAAVSPAAQFADEQVLMAVASATGALCRFSGPPLSEMGIRILSLINSPGQPKLAQQRALRELESLK